MKNLVHITVSLFFEISDSEMFGGIGSLGYTEHKFGCNSSTVNISEEYIKEHQ